MLLAAAAFDVANKAQGKPSIIGAITSRFGGGKTSEKKVESSS